MGFKVEDSDQVEVEGQRIGKSTKHKKIYLAFNRPIGMVAQQIEVEPDNIIDFIKYPSKFFLLEDWINKVRD